METLIIDENKISYGDNFSLGARFVLNLELSPIVTGLNFRRQIKST
jgi:hypothetical protein